MRFWSIAHAVVNDGWSLNLLPVQSGPRSLEAVWMFALSICEISSFSSGSSGRVILRRVDSKMIGKQPFGRTGHQSTVTLFGAAALERVSQSDADRTFEVLFIYCVNHIDTFPDDEEEALPGRFRTAPGCMRGA